LIKDENDNVPKFEKSAYNFTIDEWTASSAAHSFKKLTNYCFGRVSAYDSDATELHSAITYELNDAELFQPKFNQHKSSQQHRHHNHRMAPAAHHNNYLVRNTNVQQLLDPSISVGNSGVANFYINATTGHVCVRDVTRLDRELKGRYDFVVTANNLNSSVHSNVHVQVNLNDLNDNRPEFLQKAYTFFVIEKDSNLVSSLISSSSAGNSNSNNKLNRQQSHKKNYPQKLMFNVNTRGPMSFVGNVKALDRDVNTNSDLVYFLGKNLK
jgi:hypothetical protein